MKKSGQPYHGRKRPLKGTDQEEMNAIPPEVDLTNTPGVYYVLTYGISALIYIFLNKRKDHPERWMPALFALWIFLFVFAALTYHIRIELFIPCLLTEFLVLFLMIRIAADIDFNNQVYFTMRAILLGEFAASLEWQLFYYNLTSLGFPLRMWNNLLTLGIVHSIVFTLIWHLEKPYREGNRLLHISRKEMLTVVFVTAVIYALSNVSYVLKDTPFSSHYISEIFTIRTLADLGGLAIVFGYHMTLQEIHVRREMENLQQMLKMQYEHYRVSEETIDLINRKYHDLKHQIAFLKSDITESQKREYLDEMEAEVRQYEAQNHTGHHIVDTILTEKHLQCQRLGIQMTAVVDGTALSFLPVMEICSLLGNALDNAIEAVQQVEDPQERLIHFSAARQKGFLRIAVGNRFRGDLKIRDGLPVTTKEDKSFHGFGVRSMKSIAEQHDGSLHTEVRDGWFRLSILIPVPAETDPRD